MNRDAKNLIDRLASHEQRFISAPFLAPAVAGNRVRVRIGQVVCAVRIRPRRFEGFGIFQPTSCTAARLQREATLAERKMYLELFPRVKLIAIRSVARGWLCAAANRGDARFRLDGLVPVQLATGVQVFDSLDCRFDGSMFWFEQLDTRADPRHAAYLRTSREQRIAAEEVNLSGLSAEHRAAYELVVWQALQPEEDPLTVSNGAAQRRELIREQVCAGNAPEHRLQATLSHAGAELIGFVESHDHLQVSYRVNGRQFTSAVDLDLGLLSAGICLDGHDRQFDLASAVGVLREGMGQQEF